LDGKGNVHKIPTLEQVIRTVNGQAKLLIEIRNGHSFYPDIERQVIDLLRVHNAVEWTVIHSFHNNILRKLRDYCQEIELHKLFVGRIPFSNIIFGYRFSNLNNPLFETVSEFSSHHRFTTGALVRRIHNKGKRINVWTPKTARRIERMINRGVDGIITDNPKLINRTKSQEPRVKSQDFAVLKKTK
jgi:glycerophosphoryl diester phosphodiesterase